MPRKYEFDYDLKNDSLFIYSPNSKAKNSIDLEDFILDFDSKKNFCGLEILNASSVLKKFNSQFDKSILTSLKKAYLKTINYGTFVIFTFYIEGTIKKKETYLNFQVPATLEAKALA